MMINRSMLQKLGTLSVWVLTLLVVAQCKPKAKKKLTAPSPRVSSANTELALNTMGATWVYTDPNQLDLSCSLVNTGSVQVDDYPRVTPKACGGEEFDSFHFRACLGQQECDSKVYPNVEGIRDTTSTLIPVTRSGSWFMGIKVCMGPHRTPSKVEECAENFYPLPVYEQVPLRNFSSLVYLGLMEYSYEEFREIGKQGFALSQQIEQEADQCSTQEPQQARKMRELMYSFSTMGPSYFDQMIRDMAEKKILEEGSEGVAIRMKRVTEGEPVSAPVEGGGLALTEGPDGAQKTEAGRLANQFNRRLEEFGDIDPESDLRKNGLGALFKSFVPGFEPSSPQLEAENRSVSPPPPYTQFASEVGEDLIPGRTSPPPPPPPPPGPPPPPPPGQSTVVSDVVDEYRAPGKAIETDVRYAKVKINSSLAQVDQLVTVTSYENGFHLFEFEGSDYRTRGLAMRVPEGTTINRGNVEFVGVDTEELKNGRWKEAFKEAANKQEYPASRLEKRDLALDKIENAFFKDKVKSVRKKSPNAAKPKAFSTDPQEVNVLRFLLDDYAKANAVDESSLTFSRKSSESLDSLEQAVSYFKSAETLQKKLDKIFANPDYTPVLIRAGDYFDASLEEDSLPEVDRELARRQALRDKYVEISKGKGEKVAAIRADLEKLQLMWTEGARIGAFNPDNASPEEMIDIVRAQGILAGDPLNYKVTGLESLHKKGALTKNKATMESFSTAIFNVFGGVERYSKGLSLPSPEGITFEMYSQYKSKVFRAFKENKSQLPGTIEQLENAFRQAEDEVSDLLKLQIRAYQAQFIIDQERILGEFDFDRLNADIQDEMKKTIQPVEKLYAAEYGVQVDRREGKLVKSTWDITAFEDPFYDSKVETNRMVAKIESKLKNGSVDYEEGAKIRDEATEALQKANKRANELTEQLVRQNVTAADRQIEKSGKLNDLTKKRTQLNLELDQLQQPDEAKLSESRLQVEKLKEASLRAELGRTDFEVKNATVLDNVSRSQEIALEDTEVKARKRWRSFNIGWKGFRKRADKGQKGLVVISPEQELERAKISHQIMAESANVRGKLEDAERRLESLTEENKKFNELQSQKNAVDEKIKKYEREIEALQKNNQITLSEKEAELQRLQDDVQVLEKKVTELDEAAAKAREADFESYSKRIASAGNADDVNKIKYEITEKYYRPIILQDNKPIPLEQRQSLPDDIRSIMAQARERKKNLPKPPSQSDEGLIARSTKYILSFLYLSSSESHCSQIAAENMKQEIDRLVERAADQIVRESYYEDLLDRDNMMPMKR